MKRSLPALLASLALPAMADDALIEAGRALFNDTALSESGLYSCASCHPVSLDLEGHTSNNTYVGLDVVADGDPAGRSSPTLWGAGRRSAWSWAGTAPSLEANIRGIIVNRMRGPEPSEADLAALAAYVRSLPLPATPFVDDQGAPTAAAPDAVRRGHELFVEAGCNSCHAAPGFDSPGPYDIGSGRELKAPALWAVQHTGPWFHDGRFASLAEAASFMWEFQMDEAPEAGQLADLVAYLEAL